MSKSLVNMVSDSLLMEEVANILVYLLVNMLPQSPSNILADALANMLTKLRCEHVGQVNNEHVD